MGNRYYNKGKKQYIPSVTTVLGIISKPFSIQWANKIGLEGTEYRKYMKEVCDIGSLMHHLIECNLKDEEPDYFKYTGIEKALPLLDEFLKWKEEHEIKVIFTEHKMVCDEYGGTCDLYCECDGVKTLIDYKTSKSIYPEHGFQLSAYKNLLALEGHEVEKCVILSIARETGVLKVKEFYNLEEEFEIFESALKLFSLKKKYEKGKK